MRVIKAALPYLHSQKSGTIINVSSIAGLTGRPLSALYASSKFALGGSSLKNLHLHYDILRG